MIVLLVLSLLFCIGGLYCAYLAYGINGIILSILLGGLIWK